MGALGQKDKKMEVGEKEVNQKRRLRLASHFLALPLFGALSLLSQRSTLWVRIKTLYEFEESTLIAGFSWTT